MQGVGGAPVFFPAQVIRDGASDVAFCGSDCFYEG